MAVVFLDGLQQYDLLTVIQTLLKHDYKENVHVISNKNSKLVVNLSIEGINISL